MGNNVRIVLADDHTILREGLRALLTADPDFEIIGEAGDGREAVRCVEKMGPDLLLMDLSMPRMSGMDAINEIKKRSVTLMWPDAFCFSHTFFIGGISLDNIISRTSNGNCGSPR